VCVFDCVCAYIYVCVSVYVCVRVSAYVCVCACGQMIFKGTQERLARSGTEMKLTDCPAEMLMGSGTSHKLHQQCLSI